MTATHTSIARIAESVGFHSSDVFRRAFERRFHTTPRRYRDRFRAERSSQSHRPRTVPGEAAARTLAAKAAVPQ
jgi:AraC-like DNA-binding protein